MIRAVSTVFLCALAVCSADPSVAGKPKPKPKPHPGKGGNGGDDDGMSGMMCNATYVGQGCGSSDMMADDAYKTSNETMVNATEYMYMCMETMDGEYRCLNTGSLAACTEDDEDQEIVNDCGGVNSTGCEYGAYCYDSDGCGSKCGMECDDCYISTCNGTVCLEALSMHDLYGLAAGGDTTDNSLMSGKMALAVGSGVALVAIVAIVALYTNRQEATDSKNGFTMVDQESQHRLPEPAHREVQLEPVSLRKDTFNL